jgi:hypothetical protein
MIEFTSPEPVEVSKFLDTLIYPIGPDQIPEGMWDVGELLGKTVRLNGEVCRIVTVETIAVLISPTNPYNHDFGIAVEDAA